jgi:release factor glutamine methyltransferase
MTKTAAPKAPSATSLNDALRQICADTGVPLSELRILAEHTTGMSRVQQVTAGHGPINPVHLGSLEVFAKRRQNGEPIAYLIGHKEFYSRPFKVTPSVLIPRPETEELVEHALTFLAQQPETSEPLRVLDIGCGSGVIAITLALENPKLEVLATDISIEALEIAKQNAKTLKAKNVQFLHSDLFEALFTQQPLPTFNLICSNPPYIQADDPHLLEGDLRFEPQLALTDNGDGLHFYRSLVEHSHKLLKPKGAVMVEHGYDQQAPIIALFKNGPYKNIEGLTDLASVPRVVVAEHASSSN